MSTSLNDLRLANLAEQAAAQASATPSPTKPGIYGNTELRTSARTQSLTDAPAEVLASVSVPVGKQGRKDARSSVSKSVSTQVLTGTNNLLDTIRLRLENKRVPPGGVKATCDMSPELSRRAKEYSLDHGGVSTRQILLELLDGFLDAEGY